MSVRREEAVRLGWNGQSPKMRERMWSEAIHPEELDQIRSSICVSDKRSWKIDAWEEREGNEHVWKKITVRITGKYRHLVTAIDQNGRSRSRTYVEFAMDRRGKRMRTREMSMSDYNIPDDDYKKLIEYCRKMDMEDRLRLFQCAISAAPGLEIAIYDSLISGVGYRTMEKQGKRIPAKEDDFYAYRRKTLATFYDRLRLFGRWKD